MKRKTNQQVAALTNRTTFRVRFSEIDSMQIVWHGEYAVSYTHLTLPTIYSV